MMLGGVNPVSRWRGTPIIFGGSASCGRPVPNQHAVEARIWVAAILGTASLQSCLHGRRPGKCRQEERSVFLDVHRKVSSGFTASDAGCERPDRVARSSPHPMPRRLRCTEGWARPHHGRMQPSSTGQLAPVGNIACFAREPMSGPVCQESQAIHTTNRDASILPSCNESEIAWWPLASYRQDRALVHVRRRAGAE